MSNTGLGPISDILYFTPATTKTTTITNNNNNIIYNKDNNTELITLKGVTS